MQVESIAECSLLEHSTIRLTCIKRPSVNKTFVLSIFEWPLKTGSTYVITIYLKNSELFIPLLLLFHTGPESHELPRIDKYLDLWLNRTQFVKILTDSHSP